MSKYRYTGAAAVFVPSLACVLQPGDVIESDEQIRNLDFIPIRDVRPERPAKED